MCSVLPSVCGRYVVDMWSVCSRHVASNAVGKVVSEAVGMGSGRTSII